jgi:NTE family protein
MGKTHANEEIDMISNRKRIGLALGGGVMRGMAHIGVLTVLEREAIPIDYVAGTSAGALVGAAYCAGFPVDRIRSAALQLHWSRLISLNFPKRGWLSTDRARNLFRQQIGDLNFEDLKIPFAAVATDIENGTPVAIREGKVIPAVLASCAVLGLIPPVEIDGRLFADGTFTNTVPVSAAREAGAEFVVGVDIFHPKLRHRRGPFNFLVTALEILCHRAGNGIYKADCLIAPDLAGKTYLRFSQAEKFIASGEQAAERKLPEIRAALNQGE